MPDNRPLTWTWRLEDQVSGTARTINGTLTLVDSTLKNVGKAADALGTGRGAAKFAAEFTIVADIVHKVEQVLTELPRKIAELTSEFAKATIEAASFDEQTEISLKYLLGSSAQAKTVLDESKRFALEAGLPFKTIAQEYRNLIMGGVKPINVPIVLQAASDVSAMRGEGAAGIASYAQAFSNIASQGQLTGRALMQFKGVLDFKTLAAELGHAGAGFRDLQRILTESPVSSDRGIQAILNSIAAKEGGVLGQVTKDFGDTIPGIIQKIKTGWELMLGSVSQAPEFGAFRAALSHVADMFNPLTKAGKELQGQVAGLATHILTLITKAIEHPEAIANLFKAAMNSAQGLLNVVQGIGTILEPLVNIMSGKTFSDLKYLLGGSGAQANGAPAGVPTGVGPPVWHQPTVRDQAQKIGGLAPVGVPRDGYAAGDAYGTSFESGVRDSLGVHSPSRAMEEIGRYVNQGLSRGMKGSAEVSTEGGSSGGGTALQVTQEFTINTDKSADKNGIAERIVELSVASFRSALEQSAIQLGAI